MFLRSSFDSSKRSDLSSTSLSKRKSILPNDSVFHTSAKDLSDDWWTNLPNRKSFKRRRPSILLGDSQVDNLDSPFPNWPQYINRMKVVRPEQSSDPSPRTSSATHNELDLPNIPSPLRFVDLKTPISRKEESAADKRSVDSHNLSYGKRKNQGNLLTSVLRNSFQKKPASDENLSKSKNFPKKQSAGNRFADIVDEEVSEVERKISSLEDTSDQSDSSFESLTDIVRKEISDKNNARNMHGKVTKVKKPEKKNRFVFDDIDCEESDTLSSDFFSNSFKLNEIENSKTTFDEVVASNKILDNSSMNKSTGMAIEEIQDPHSSQSIERKHSKNRFQSLLEGSDTTFEGADTMNTSNQSKSRKFFKNQDNRISETPRNEDFAPSKHVEGIIKNVSPQKAERKHSKIKQNRFQELDYNETDSSTSTKPTSRRSGLVGDSRDSRPNSKLSVSQKSARQSTASLTLIHEYEQTETRFPEKGGELLHSGNTSSKIHKNSARPRNRFEHLEFEESDTSTSFRKSSLKKSVNKTTSFSSNVSDIAILPRVILENIAVDSNPPKSLPKTRESKVPGKLKNRFLDIEMDDTDSSTSTVLPQEMANVNDARKKFEISVSKTMNMNELPGESFEQKNSERSFHENDRNSSLRDFFQDMDRGQSNIREPSPNNSIQRKGKYKLNNSVENGTQPYSTEERNSSRVFKSPNLEKKTNVSSERNVAQYSTSLEKKSRSLIQSSHLSHRNINDNDLIPNLSTENHRVVGSSILVTPENQSLRNSNKKDSPKNMSRITNYGASMTESIKSPGNSSLTRKIVFPPSVNSWRNSLSQSQEDSVDGNKKSPRTSPRKNVIKSFAKSNNNATNSLPSDHISSPSSERKTKKISSSFHRTNELLTPEKSTKDDGNMGETPHRDVRSGNEIVNQTLTSMPRRKAPERFPRKSPSLRKSIMSMDNSAPRKMIDNDSEDEVGDEGDDEDGDGSEEEKEYDRTSRQSLRKRGSKTNQSSRSSDLLNQKQENMARESDEGKMKSLEQTPMKRSRPLTPPSGVITRNRAKRDKHTKSSAESPEVLSRKLVDTSSSELELGSKKEVLPHSYENYNKTNKSRKGPSTKEKGRFSGRILRNMKRVESESDSSDMNEKSPEQSARSINKSIPSPIKSSNNVAENMKNRKTPERLSKGTSQFPPSKRKLKNRTDALNQSQQETSSESNENRKSSSRLSKINSNRMSQSSGKLFVSMANKTTRKSISTPLSTKALGINNNVSSRSMENMSESTDEDENHPEEMSAMNRIGVRQASKTILSDVPQKTILTSIPNETSRYQNVVVSQSQENIGPVADISRTSNELETTNVVVSRHWFDESSSESLEEDLEPNKLQKEGQDLLGSNIATQNQNFIKDVSMSNLQSKKSLEKSLESKSLAVSQRENIPETNTVMKEVDSNDLDINQELLEGNILNRSDQSNQSEKRANRSTYSRSQERSVVEPHLRIPHLSERGTGVNEESIRENWNLKMLENADSNNFNELLISSQPSPILNTFGVKRQKSNILKITQKISGINKTVSSNVESKDSKTDNSVSKKKKNELGKERSELEVSQIKDCTQTDPGTSSDIGIESPQSKRFSKIPKEADVSLPSAVQTPPHSAKKSANKEAVNEPDPLEAEQSSRVNPLHNKSNHQKPNSHSSVINKNANESSSSEISRRKISKALPVSSKPTLQTSSALPLSSKTVTERIRTSSLSSVSSQSEFSIGDVSELEDEPSAKVLEKYPDVKAELEKALALRDAPIMTSNQLTQLTSKKQKQNTLHQYFLTVQNQLTVEKKTQFPSIQRKATQPKKAIKRGPVYKKFKLAMPAPWINKRFYKKITDTFSKDLEEFEEVNNAEVEMYILELHNLVKAVLRHVPSKKKGNGDKEVLAVMTHLYKRGLIKSKMDFLRFCRDYLPGPFLSRGMFYPFPNGPNIPSQKDNHLSAKYLLVDLKLC